MANVWEIAKKELLDLVSSKFVLAIFILYLLHFINIIQQANTFYISSGRVSHWGYETDLLTSIVDGLVNIMAGFGCLIAIIVGYTSIFNEKRGHAINTLMVKPLYRDSIINGKFLGALIFFLCLFIFIVALYTSFMILIVKGAIGPIFFDYLLNTPAAIFLAILMVMIFYLVSIFVSILIKDQSSSLFICALIWALTAVFIPATGFAGYISLFFGKDQEYVYQLIRGISPQSFIHDILMANTGNLYGQLMQNNLDIIKFIIFLIILLIFDYIIFLRRDVS